VPRAYQVSSTKGWRLEGRIVRSPKSSVRPSPGKVPKMLGGDLHLPKEVKFTWSINSGARSPSGWRSSTAKSDQGSVIKDQEISPPSGARNARQRLILVGLAFWTQADQVNAVGEHLEALQILLGDG